VDGTHVTGWISLKPADRSSRIFNKEATRINRQVHSTSPLLIFKSLWCNRDLIGQMVQREVVGRYRGSLMGLLWSFFNPLLMLLVYTFVFSVVFNARWGEGTGDRTEFAIILFAGLIVHSLFAECLNRSPGLILSNVNYVKKVVFSLEILPWVAMGSTLFHTAVSVLVLLIFYSAIHASLNLTVIFLPFVLFPLVLLTMGVSWFLASLGVYLRDVGHTVGILTTVLLFMSPIFYPISALPERLRPFLLLNPLTFIIEQTRAVIIWGRMPDWKGLALYFTLSLLVAWMGLYWFQRTRKGFADVL
jgi:lipopolysaccharide transport system permease protein